MIEKITLREDEQCIYINKDKYFEGVTPEVWNYRIGGYIEINIYILILKHKSGPWRQLAYI
jgi:hypothetical protein